MEKILTKENFENEVLNCELPVIVDFWASWCGPCMMMAPVIKEIAAEYEGKVKVGKVNVDDEPELSLEYGISSIPAIMLFKDGKRIKTSVGYSSKEELKSELNI